MKVLILLFLVAVMSQGALAQTSSSDRTPPDVVIAGFDFKTVTYVSGDPRRRSGIVIQPTPLAEDRFEPSLNRHTSYGVEVSFNYAVLDVSNRGTKTVKAKAIEWDFAYPRVVNHQAVPRHHVRRKVNIAPGETRKLKASLPHHPRQPRCGRDVKIRGVRQPSLSRDPDCDVLRSMRMNPYQERVSIKRVEYTDGSVWQRP